MRSALFAMVSALVMAGTAHAEEPIVFTSAAGDEVEAFQGRFQVPENRANPDSRMIEIGYVRFPAYEGATGDPIVYLSGGPGGSGTGTAERQRFDLFMQMRAHGDVIAYDQRGTGLSSNNLPGCASNQVLPATEYISDEAYTQAYRDAAQFCYGYWQDLGVEIEGYTTQDSVADLSALREHLGAEQLTLWGISYGTHLAMAALKTMPDEIDRAILGSAEGLDQTVKLPSRTDAYIERLQSAVNTQPQAAEAYPDIAGLMRRVHARLDAEPMMISVPQRDGSRANMLLHRRDIQRMASGLISDPASAAIMLAMYAELDAGGSQIIGFVSARFFQAGAPIRMRAMPTAMDLASGISEARLTQVQQEAQTSLLKDYLNFPMPQLSGVWDGFGLDDAFRTDPTGDTPILLLSGTLDGRTYVDSQREALARMEDVTAITVVNAGHNLFMTTPEVHEAMHAFMRGEAPATTEIIAPLPDMTELPLPR